jgi:hypothetical protein
MDMPCSGVKKYLIFLLAARLAKQRVLVMPAEVIQPPRHVTGGKPYMRSLCVYL